MNVVLVGYGKMGKMVEIVAKQRGHNVSAVFDINDNVCERADLQQLGDVVIEFSTPNTAKQNVLHCLNCSVPVVCGTTGWEFNAAEISLLCEKNHTAMFYASNYSIGMNIFMQINKKLAQLLQTYPDYKASIDETHHIHKLDKPSGTAITLAKDIISSNANYKMWQLDSKCEEVVGIHSYREGEVFGTHTVRWENECDEILITHSAKNRKGLALGAVLAAEYVIGKCGLFGMNNLLQL